MGFSPQISRVPAISRRLANLVQGMEVTETTAMRMGDKVIVLGAQSGPTTGVFSAIESRVTLPGLEPARTTTEFVVTARPGRGLVKPGDSGAFLLNGEGALVGVL